MPINAGYEYGEAQKKVAEAKNSEEKIRALEFLLSVSPDHKGTERLRSELKTKISKLKEKQEKDRASKKGGHSLSIKKEGAAQIALVGLTNSGKSTVISRFTNAKLEIADYEYTTKNPEIGVMDYNGVKLQLIEIPPIFDGFYESSNGPSYFNIIRSADLIVVIIDGTKDSEKNLELIDNEFHKAGMTLKKIKEDNKFYHIIKCIVIINKVLKNFKSKYRISWVDDFKEAVWSNLNLIYAYTKQPGKEKEYPPVALKIGSTVKDLAEIVHKDFIKNFKYAKIWGKSVKHNNTSAGLDHVLKENDVVEFHVK